MKLKCSGCGGELSDLAYVAWVENTKTKLVESFGVYCREPTDDSDRGCSLKIDRLDRQEGKFLRDGPIEWFIGPRRAMDHLVRLMWQYRWEPGSKALSDCLDFFAEASREPVFGKPSTGF